LEGLGAVALGKGENVPGDVWHQKGRGISPGCSQVMFEKNLFVVHSSQEEEGRGWGVSFWAGRGLRHIVF